jgi:cell division initiation protein
MKITPLEIRQKDFIKTFRGYDKEEVDAYLKSLSNAWERLLDELEEVKKQNIATEAEVKRLREVEDSLFKTLRTAEETGTNLIEQANRSANLQVREAQVQAEAVLAEARSKARTMLEEADHQIKSRLDDLRKQVEFARKEYLTLDKQREKMLEEMRTLAQDFLNRVDKQVTLGLDKDMEAHLEAIKLQEARLAQQLELNLKPLDVHIQKSQPVEEPKKKVEAPKEEKEIQQKNTTESHPVAIVKEPQPEPKPEVKPTKETDGAGESFFDNL